MQPRGLRQLTSSLAGGPVGLRAKSKISYVLSNISYNLAVSFYLIYPYILIL